MPDALFNISQGINDRVHKFPSTFYYITDRFPERSSHRSWIFVVEATSTWTLPWLVSLHPSRILATELAATLRREFGALLLETAHENDKIRNRGAGSGNQ